MFDLLKARWNHGYQAIPDPLRAAVHPSFPGLPQILRFDESEFQKAAEFCPAKAISSKGLDLGKCIFCGLCSRKFPETFKFTPDFRMASSTRDGLIINWDSETGTSSKPIVTPNPDLKRFRRSLAMRNVSAGGCNACELELGACSNVNFDMGRYGFEVVASPRHADALILTGPVSANMAFALRETWAAIPEPKILILSGVCALSGGLFASGGALDRSLLEELKPALYIPGCPAHPLSIIHGIMSLLGRVK